MVRSIAAIVAALHIANPHLSRSTSRLYAEALQRSARVHRYDPFTAVAIGWHESHWIATAVSPNGCFGLFQVCVRDVYPYCVGEGFYGARCEARKAELLDGVHAIGVLGSQIERWERYCRRATGRPALLPRWLAGYQGADAKRGTTCNQRKVRGSWRDAPLAPVTRSVISYRKKLVRRVP